MKNVNCRSSWRKKIIMLLSMQSIQKVRQFWETQEFDNNSSLPGMYFVNPNPKPHFIGLLPGWQEIHSRFHSKLWRNKRLTCSSHNCDNPIHTVYHIIIIFFFNNLKISKKSQYIDQTMILATLQLWNVLFLPGWLRQKMSDTGYSC